MLNQKGRIFRNTLKRSEFVETAAKRAFHRGAVVADLPEDERIVHLADLFQRVEDASNFVIGLRGIGGEDFHQPLSYTLLVRRERIPGGNLFGSRRQFRV